MALIGVVDGKAGETARFTVVLVGCPKRFEAKNTLSNAFFFLRFGDFCAYNNDDRTDYFTPCACAWGIKGRPRRYDKGWYLKSINIISGVPAAYN